MYGGLGLLIGIVGHSMVANEWQQAISIGTGVLLIGVGLATLFGRHVQRMIRLQQAVVKPIINWIGYWLHRPGGHFMVGVLNGLLPCGMVYMALAGALNADSVHGAGLFMLLFGLGTWPAMLSISMIGNIAKRCLRLNLTFWIPLICLLMGGWFLLRGANFDIPYLSPLIYPEGAITCH